MSADLLDEQAKKMTRDITDIKEQWKILIEGLNISKERLMNLRKISSNLFFSDIYHPIL
jgi:hypothetical protein